jgi:hypothetical protein
MIKTAAYVLAALVMLGATSKSGAAPVLEQIGEFTVPEANQGVGVDARHFYAVDNYIIGKYDKKTGKLLKKWQGAKSGPIVHLDSAMLMDGKLYAAHSNYPEWPMTSSLEIFDAETMEHIGTHSFGIQWGSLTWVDWHDSHWWMTFANYDRLFGPGKTPYGHKANTVMVKFTKDFRPLQSWTLPKAILDRFEDMSNSGAHGAGRIPLPHWPRPGGALSHAVAESRFSSRTCGRHSNEHPGPGHRLGPLAAGHPLRNHRATVKERALGGNHKVTAFRLVEKP